MITVEVWVYTESGHLWEEHLLVDMPSRKAAWPEVIAKVIAARPQYEGRRMNGQRLSKAILAMHPYNEMEHI